MRLGQGPFRTVAVACAIVVAALAVRVGYGLAKTDWHVDEGITLAITNGAWATATHEGLMERWMGKAELEEIVFNGNLRARGSVDFAGIAETTARDVHPPLFYWLFAAARLVMGVGNWIGACLFLNGACFALTALFLALATGRASGDWRVTLVTLALFAFSPAAVAVTQFARMYELLQTECMGFLCCAIFILYPGESRAGGASRALAVVGLMFFSFLGLLTHYYYLVFIAPVVAVSAISLARRRAIATLLWCVLAIGIGLFAAWHAFPAMEQHLTRSDRAMQGIESVRSVNYTGIASKVLSYAGIVLRYVPAIGAALAGGAVATVSAILRRRRRKGIHDSAKAIEAAQSGDRSAVCCVALLATVFVCTFVVIAVSAPYRTLRYLVAFTPAYTMLGASIVFTVLSRVRGFVVLVAVLALSVVPGLLPGNISTFHEDYRVDGNPSYFADDKPIIIVSNRQGFTWKNMLPYAAIPRGKRVYVALRDGSVDLSLTLAPAVASSGADSAYAMVDVLFPAPRSLERVGHYGFFGVYRVDAR